MRAYSIDLRQKVMEKLEQGHSIRKVADMFGIHFTTIQNWRKRDSLAPKKRTSSHYYKINPQELLADVQAYPDDYQYERAKRFHCSQAAIQKALKRLKITNKKNTLSSQSQQS